jgi:hypothetical protein
LPVNKQVNYDKPFIAGVKKKALILEDAKIGKTGKISYETKDGGLFVDYGNKIILIKNTKEAQEKAYELASKKFENTISIHGDIELWKNRQKNKGLER